ncbi:hypothetical protein GA0061071_101310 [Kosakonia oryzendophytica]|uniref:Uncharacterized protein n=1 Tax=Kosakonia oryzendophytica TaxID=1005665 RepID=A0A1C3Z2G7_9ENTR|nr:hypothetical protein GA0061071_101310 [Kosakonia oryzendophytica]
MAACFAKHLPAVLLYRTHPRTSCEKHACPWKKPSSHRLIGTLSGKHSEQRVIA